MKILDENNVYVCMVSADILYFITWVWDEVRIVSPSVWQPILLEKSALLLCGPDKLGLVATALGAPGPEDEADQDNHQDQDRDDGQEDPHYGGHLDSLNSYEVSGSVQ